MISGRTGGSGKYSYHETSGIHETVLVAHMPEDSFSVRVVFREYGETGIPTLKLREHTAMLLWSSLKRIAEDLKWDDRMPSEVAEGKKVGV